ncbi:DegT/DnrJ/EryC1/StrS family aminotransferase [Christensenellaceae bacterium OttesenSCG-928-K19]|nr:DegT/DnrJ/EryC1/StrS family aminotransferase [Christensenellaceae bacterium OttesenSCG-928-K19]
MKKHISVAMPNFLGNEKKYVQDCMDTVWISSVGKYIAEFEAAFSSKFGAEYAVSCSNGTVAIHLALLALGIGPGDEVLVPSFTYIASANAVRYCGATPVFCDCLADTWGIDVEDARKKVGPRTKAIMPVHLYGNPCDMKAVMAFASEYDLKVVEDAAECHGAEFDGKKAGTIGDIGTFSFFGNKIITTGEGGMVVTNNKSLDDKVRLLKGQGMDPERRYWFTEVGYNYRMTNIQAAIGLAQLEDMERHIEARQNIAKRYDALFSGRKSVQKQQQTRGAESVCWMYSLLLTDNAKITRDALMEKLDEDGIETRPLFYPMHSMPPYYNEKAGCPVSEDIAARGLNIPTHELLSSEDVAYIAGTILNYTE